MIPVLLMFTLGLLIVSCDKKEDTQTLDEVFDFQGLQDMNSQVTACKNLDEVAALFADADDFEVPVQLKGLSLPKVISKLETDMVINQNERNQLISNDADTYMSVIDRLGDLAFQYEKLNVDLSGISKSKIKKYNVNSKQELSDFHMDDYYAASTELQNFISDEILAPIEYVNNLQQEKSATLEFDQGVFIHYYTYNLWEIFRRIREWLRNRFHNGSSGGF